MNNNDINDSLKNFAEGKRSNIKEDVIYTPDGEVFTLLRKEITILTETGDFETTTCLESFILDTGEKISSHLQIKGRCGCGSFVTHKSARLCRCGILLCPTCAEYYEPTRIYACKKCYRKLKRKRLIFGIINLIVYPFVKKEELYDYQEEISPETRIRRKLGYQGFNNPVHKYRRNRKT